MWERELFSPDYVKTIHIVVFSNKSQLCFYRKLHCNPHYSLSDIGEVVKLNDYCSGCNIDVKLYENITNYTDFTGSAPIVLNSIYDEIMEVSKKRNSTLMKN